jgi:hypothetical protein
MILFFVGLFWAGAGIYGLVKHPLSAIPALFVAGFISWIQYPLNAWFPPSTIEFWGGLGLIFYWVFPVFMFAWLLFKSWAKSARSD